MHDHAHHHAGCGCTGGAPVGRRVVLGGLAAFGLASAAGVAGPARAAGETEALVLSCMDYRLRGRVAAFMVGRGLRNRYDHVIMAGASLAVLNDRFPAWGQTFWDHVQIAIDLHHIKRVIAIDHRDCGAYKTFVGVDHAKDRATETATHARYLRRLRDDVLARHPGLAVETHLMALDGKVESIV